MAVKLVTNYSKRLGLPGYSSHQFSVSVETELTNVEDVAGESARLYIQLQESVDEQMQNTGFVPPHEYGMAPGQTGNGHAHGGNVQPGNGNGNGHRPPAAAERWNCTDGQKGLIQRVVHENQLDKNEVENMAQQLFGIGVKQLDKMQASQLIEDLLEKTGKKQRGSRWGNRQGARA
jgi:hypothetical protein